MSNTDNRPVVYVIASDNGVLLSAYSPDDEQFEMNHIELRESHYGVLRNTSISATSNVLRNVLEQAGVRVIME